MKTKTVILALFLTSISYADNMFSYDNLQRARFRDTQTNYAPPPVPVEIDYGNDRDDHTSIFQNAMDSYDLEQDRRVQQEIEAQLEKMNQDAEMRYYQNEASQ